MILLLLTWLAAPLLLLWVALRRRPAQPQRILLIQTAKIGDFVSTTPLLREIKRALPQAQLAVVLHQTNLPLARHNPHIDELLPLPAQGLRGMAGRLWLLRALHTRRIDTVICASPSLAGWLMPLWTGVARRMSVVPNYGGRSYRMARPLLTHAEPHRAGRRVIETQAALLAQIGIRAESLMTEAFAAPGAEQAAERILPADGRAAIGLGVSAGNKLKELGVGRLVELARGLVNLSGARLVLIGGPDDRVLAEQVTSQLPVERVTNAVGLLGLDMLPALLRYLSAYVGVDSGITYLADACGVPVVDLMGPADADDQRPGGPHAIVLRSALPCAPCSHAFKAPYHCAIGTRACIRDVALDTVTRAVGDLLKAAPRRG